MNYWNGLNLELTSLQNRSGPFTSRTGYIILVIGFYMAEWGTCNGGFIYQNRVLVRFYMAE